MIYIYARLEVITHVCYNEVKYMLGQRHPALLMSQIAAIFVLEQLDFWSGNGTCNAKKRNINNDKKEIQQVIIEQHWSAVYIIVFGQTVLSTAIY